MKSFDETKLNIFFELPEDLQMLKVVVSSFESSIGTEMKNLIIATLKKNVLETTRILHKMKGCCGCVSAIGFMELLQTMEELSDKNDIASVSDSIPILQKEFKILKFELQSYINNYVC